MGTLVEYLGDITETNLKDNFDIVYMVSENDIHFLRSVLLTPD